MPLTGELEHLPIVDVIQLIHSTRKSGTLNVYSRKGEGQLVFDKGFIVGASHSDDKIRIGQILLENQIIDQAKLDKALQIQKKAGANRRPLITTLVEHCDLTKEYAYKGLETLIEMTVVEMISWTRGIFSLDVDKLSFSDDYRYLPSQLEQVTLDTQMVLMDALRIFDEKVHAGEIEIVDAPLEEAPHLENDSEDPEQSGFSDIELDEDILGLGDLDKIERKKPRVFKSLEAFDPTEIHRQVISKTLPELTTDQSDQLVNFLTDASTPSFADDGGLMPAAHSQAIVMFCSDEFLQHAVMTVCKKDGILVFLATDGNQLDNLIDQAMNKGLEPILVFGSPKESQGGQADELVALRQKKQAQYPQVSIIQLASPLDYAFSLQSLNDGIRAVFPKPYYHERQETFASDTINFLNSFQTYVRGCFNEERRQQFARLRNSLSGLRMLSKAPDISLSVLQFVAESFPRALTLILDKNELIAERSIGISGDKEQGPSAPLQFRMPLLENSLFSKPLKNGTTFFGPVPHDGTLSEYLYQEIGAPLDPTILLLPLKSNERLITLTYADFGNSNASQVPLDFLDFFVSQAGMTMENALLRKQFGRSNDRQPQTKV